MYRRWNKQGNCKNILLKLLLPNGAASRKTTALVCRVGCISALMAIYVRMQTVAEELLHECTALSNHLTPVLIAATAFSGAEASAALVNPMAAVAADLIQNILLKWGIAICFAAAVIAAAGNLSGSISLKQLHSFLKRILHWGAGGMVAVFSAMLSVCGRLSAGRDSAAARTAKYSIENLIPVVGGNVADSMGSLLAAADTVKNAIGVSGLALTVFVCIFPVVHLLIVTFILQFTAAVSEPLADNYLTVFVRQLSDSIEMLLILCAAGAMLCGLLIGSSMDAVIGIVQ